MRGGPSARVLIDGLGWYPLGDEEQGHEVHLTHQLNPIRIQIALSLTALSQAAHSLVLLCSAPCVLMLHPVLSSWYKFLYVHLGRSTAVVHREMAASLCMQEFWPLLKKKACMVGRIL